MNISKIAFAILAVGAIILLSVSISEKDAGTYAKRALRKTVVHASKTYNNRRLQNTKVNCGFVHMVLKELRNCFYYPPSLDNYGEDCVFDALTQNEVLKDHSWVMYDFRDKASHVLYLGSSDSEVSFPEVSFPEYKANEIIHDVSGICENGTPFEDDLTLKEFNARIGQYLDANVLPACVEYGKSLDYCEMFLDAINTALTWGYLGRSLDVASMSSEAGLLGTAGVWKKILYGVSISGSMWY